MNKKSAPPYRQDALLKTLLRVISALLYKVNKITPKHQILKALNMDKVIILGTAHLRTTPGKRSIDGRLKEYKYSREIVADVEERLTAQGFNVYVDYRPADPNAQMLSSNWITEQKRELAYRVGIVNDLCTRYGKQNCVYISIHVNAAGGDGEWHTASGFTVFVSNNASTASKRLAQSFTVNALDADLCGNRYIPLTKYWQSNLYVLRKTACPAVLTENLFQDNKDDVDFLLSDEGRRAIVDLHVKTISDYAKVK